MLRFVVGLCWLSFISPAVLSGGESDAQITKLQQRIATLEAENAALRNRLRKIEQLATAELPVPESTLRILVTGDNWGDANTKDIQKVLHSAALPLWEAAGKPPLHPILVIKSSEGPLVAYRRGENLEYRVLLNVEGRLWARFAYQFSHEFCHILANYREVPNAQLWFEESLCECASLFALRQMGHTWKVTPPYANWKSYANSLTTYADDRIAKVAPMSDDDLAKWYAKHRPELEKSGTNRELNAVLAVRLLKMFEQSPAAWQAVRAVNRGDAGENSSLAAYLSGWHSRAEADDRKVIKEIAKALGISLK